MRTSRKLCNAIRRDRRLSPPIADLFAKMQVESEEKRITRVRAEALYTEFNNRGANWAACVQAVKTNWVANLINKYR